MKKMQAIVDQTLCDTSGRCVELAPEVFCFQPGSKKATARSTYVPSKHKTKCREAAAQCPRHAIRLLVTET